MTEVEDRQGIIVRPAAYQTRISISTSSSRVQLHLRKSKRSRCSVVSHLYPVLLSAKRPLPGSPRCLFPRAARRPPHPALRQAQDHPLPPGERERKEPLSRWERGWGEGETAPWAAEQLNLHHTFQGEGIRPPLPWRERVGVRGNKQTETLPAAHTRGCFASPCELT